jgi:ribonuclease P protein component
MISKVYRLRRWKVKKILKKGETVKSNLFIIKKLPNKKNFNRWAVVLSRKFAKLATIRNKKRRQIYEAIRNSITVYQQEKETYFDIVLIPYKEILTCNYQKIHQNIIDILKSL